MTKTSILINIRKQQGVTAAQLSEKLGYHRTYWAKIESGEKPLAPKIIEKLKNLLGVSFLILTAEDKKIFKQELDNWKDAIIRRDLERATTMKTHLANTLEITPDNGLMRLYNIYSIGYFRIHNNMEALDAQISIMKAYENEFNEEESYWYYRQTAIRAHNLNDCRTAIDAFLKTEYAGDLLGINNEGLYYNIGHCLTDMGYAGKAIQYFEKALNKAMELGSHAYDIYAKNMMSLNFIIMGRASDALSMLMDCLHLEQQKNEASVTMGLIYRRMAMAHSELGDLDAAIENANKSFDYLEPDSDPYVENLYYLAVMYLSNNKKREALANLNKGISLAKITSAVYIMLNALKHSLNFKNDESREYVETIAVPKLNTYSKNLPLLDCYAKLGEYYKKHDEAKSSMYYKKAYMLSEKLRKGDLSK